MIKTVNPTTGEILKQYPEHTSEEIETCLDELLQGWKKWKSLSFQERGKAFVAVGKKLLEKKEEFARLIALEMGKPIKLGRVEIEKCARACDYFATHASKFLQEETVQAPGTLKKAMIKYQPMGIILGIMPWNFPFWQVFRAVTTSVMAGNVFLLKHAPISTGSSLAIEEIFREVVPIAIFRSAILNDNATSELISHEKIAGVTLTGSIRAGRAVAQHAARSLKKCVLELGGSDPYVILADADLSLAAKTCVQARLSNSGQVCIAPKRIIVVSAIYDEFRRHILEHVHSYSCGDPLKEATLLGPMAREDLREQLNKQVQESIEKGAKLVVGGKLSADKGFYYPPTVLENVVPGMPAFDDELFGPVVSLVRAKDEDDAIRLANLSPFGLGAGIFTQGTEHGEYLATHRIDAGACFVNGTVSSDPSLPFGGMKTSGMGYELGAAGIREFVHIKTIGIA